MTSILYVDDEPDLLDLGKIFLEQNGTFDVTTAGSGLSALDLLKRRQFDAVVPDFMMPGMSGIQLLQNIRKSSDIPFILFTGKGREEVVIDAINNGADFYLQKGGDPQAQFAELGHKINQAVNRRRAERALRKRLALVRKASDASTRFIRLRADEIDAAIDQLLGEIGTLMGVDRCYLAKESEIPGQITWIHEWVGPGGIPSLPEQRNQRKDVDFSSTAMKIRNMESVIVPSVAAMQAGPDGNTREKQFLEKNNIKSFLILPLTIGPSVIGALGLETLQNETLWPEEDIDILKIYGQIIAGALARKAGEQAVHESEELYRTVFESTGTAMMILEENRMVSVVNREFERISEYSRDQVVGKIPWTAFVSPEDLERMKQYHALRRTNPDKVPRNYEFGFLSRDGKKISTYITVEMIPGTKKSVVSLINISREKSAQQELSDSEEKFRNLSESLAEGIYMIQDNRFIYVNPAFSRICGRSTEELTALTDFTEIFPESDRQRVRQSVSDRLSGLRTSERYSVSAIHKNGTLIPLTIHGSLTRYHGRQALIGTITMAGDP